MAKHRLAVTDDEHLATQTAQRIVRLIDGAIVDDGRAADGGVMGAVRLKTVADLRRRRLQALGIAAVLLLSTASATLALHILVESHAPFDRAFAATNGAHLIVRYRGDRFARLAATATAPGVTASAGPWPVARGAIGEAKNRIIVAGFSGRPAPDASIDAADIEAGRWWTAPGEVVLSDSTARTLDRRVGGTVMAYPPPLGGKGPANQGGGSSTPGRELTVVGMRPRSAPRMSAPG